MQNSVDEYQKKWLGEGNKTLFKSFYPIAVISFLLFAPPDGLAYTSLYPLRYLWWLLLFLNCGILLVVFLVSSLRGRGKKLDTVILLAVLTFVPIVLFTFSNDGSKYELLKRAVYIFGPWLYLAVFGEYGFKSVLKAMLIASILLIVSNFASMIVMYSHGSFRPQYGDTWLFGQRTYMRNFLFPCLLFSILNDRLKNKRISVITFSIAGLTICSVIIGDAMTSLVVFVLMILTLLFFSNRMKRIPIFRLYFIGSIALDILLVHIRNIEMFRGLIEDILGRNMTLSYRTQAWDIALEETAKHPFAGTGINDPDESGIVVGYGKELSNTHNQFLDTWFKGGIISALFFLALVVRCVFPLLKNQHYWAVFIMGVFLGGFCIEAIVGEVWYPQFFLLLYLSAYINNWAPLFEKKHGDKVSNKK